MATQRDENRYAVMCQVPLDTLAKIKTAIKGMRVPFQLGHGRVSEKTRAKTISDFIIEAAITASASVEPDNESLAWAEEQRRKLRSRSLANYRIGQDPECKRYEVAMVRRRNARNALRSAQEALERLRAANALPATLEPLEARVAACKARLLQQENAVKAVLKRVNCK